MFRQKCLEFLEPQRWEALWTGFPEQARAEVTRQCARLMARVSVQRIRALRTQQEADHEPGR